MGIGHVWVPAHDQLHQLRGKDVAQVYEHFLAHFLIAADCWWLLMLLVGLGMWTVRWMRRRRMGKGSPSPGRPPHLLTVFWKALKGEVLIARLRGLPVVRIPAGHSLLAQISLPGW